MRDVFAKCETARRIPQTRAEKQADLLDPIIYLPFPAKFLVLLSANPSGFQAGSRAASSFVNQRMVLCQPAVQGGLGHGA